MLKGTATIELTDVKTGKKEIVKHDNLVTNAVSDILSLNPFGARYRNSAIYENAQEADTFENVFLPVIPNLIGGILLYGDALPEDPDRYYAPMDNPLVGYSNNEVSPNKDERRGSMNQTESGKLTDGTGYRFVFDFATSQGNGTISSLGLTSRWGGVAGYGNKNAADFPYHAMKIASHEAGGFSYADASLYGKALRSIVSIDPDTNTALAAFVSDANTVKIYKFKFPITEMGVFDTFSPSLTLLNTVTLATTSFAATITDGVFYGTLIDGGDGNIWGFQHSGNVEGNSSGNATILWIKINKEDFSFEEGSWTIGAQLLKFGHYYVPIASVHSKCCNYAIIKDGVLYAIAYTSDVFMYAVYAIPLDNPADITRYSADSGFRYDPEAWASSVLYGSTAVNELNGVIRYAFGSLAGGSLKYTNGSLQKQATTTGFGGAIAGCPKPQLRYGPYIFGIFNRNGTYRLVETYLMTTYLATINNLETPVTKTADKTMKITYILREE